MNKGMMWFDDDKSKSVEEKIGRAVDYYTEKYGSSPNLCCVSSKAFEDEFSVGDISVKPQKYIRPQHFWVGVQA